MRVEIRPDFPETLQNLNGFKINALDVVSRTEPFVQLDLYIAGWHPELKKTDPLCKFGVTKTNHQETQIRVVRLVNELPSL